MKRKKSHDDHGAHMGFAKTSLENPTKDELGDNAPMPRVNTKKGHPRGWIDLPDSISNAYY